MKTLEERGIIHQDAWRRSVESVLIHFSSLKSFSTFQSCNVVLWIRVQVSAVIGKELANLPPSEWKDRSSHFTSSLTALQHLIGLPSMPRMGQLFPAPLPYGIPFPKQWVVDLEPELENISNVNMMRGRQQYQQRYQMN